MRLGTMAFLRVRVVRCRCILEKASDEEGEGEFCIYCAMMRARMGGLEVWRMKSGCEI